MESPVKLEGKFSAPSIRVTMANRLTQGEADEIEAGIKTELGGEGVDKFHVDHTVTTPS